MDIAGYDIPDQYVIGGAGILLVGGFLLSRRGTPTEETATIRPAEGLSWQDIIGQSDDAKLIGPGGPIGTPGGTGPPGAPGPGTQPKCTKNSDCKGPNRRCRDGKCVRVDSDGPVPDCNKDNQCRNNERCRNGKCVEDRPDRDRNTGRDRNEDKNLEDFPTIRPDKNREGNRDHNRPDMPRKPDDNRNISDPRLDKPKDRKRRDESSNKIDRKEKDRRRDSFRDRIENRFGNRVSMQPIQVNPRSGAIRHPDRDSRQRDRNRDKDRDRDRSGKSSSDASGGTIRLGDIDKGTNLNIDVSGGRAVERNRRGRGGYGVAGLQTDGYGRLDGKGTSPDGFVRTNISPGSITGSFTPGPQALSGRRDSIVIKKNETLKGLAKRAYGESRFWPRIVTLNNDVLLPEGEIPAGTRIRI